MRKRTQTRFSARMIQGARPSDMPGFVAPQLAASRARAPSGDQWLHEIKYDGYRVQLHVDKQRRIIFTRTGLDWTKRFAVIAGAFDIPVERAILDGEIVVIRDGRTSFAELQAELAKGNQDRLLFYAFDLLYLEGFDLTEAALVERKRILKMLFDETGLQSPIVYSEHLQTDGNQMLAHACKLKFEGIISKNAQAPYRSERSDAWIKVKCLQRGKFPVVGFVKDAAGVAALHLGRQDGKDLVYAGKVGTGWSRTVSGQIRKKLDSVLIPTSKLTRPIRDPKAIWVEPTFLADVEYRDTTAEGLLRAASFKGLTKRTG
ncbi:non-homologous end-joining DNA ligase [Bradyrhizobium sp.]|uniref:non-homologous end-joining DNA ligase n=1 Tax=Bradyrhizobium sp. TaxID=376 RepID=UPI0025BA04BF|nr:non-homologous end-joining DNA ligase [Bradyrhizobium sp.]